MNNVTPNSPNISNQRIESIDALRGIIILLMIFVNDIAGVSDAPQWMKHLPVATDGMTFADWVFPAFLFMVGMAIPFSVGKRLDLGESMLQTWKHILTRTIGLLVIGVFMANAGSLSKDEGINLHIFNLIMYAGVILVWSVLPGVSKSNKYLNFGIKFIGILILTYCGFLFKINSQLSLIQMETDWWGIIGLIGWAYFVACIFYIPMRRQLSGIIGAMAFLYCIYVADKSGYFSNLSFILNWIDIGKFLGTHSAIVVSGIALGMILKPDSPIKTHKSRLWWAFWYGVGLATAGSMINQLATTNKIFILDKDLATPSWGLWSSAFTAWLFVIIYWLMDVKGVKGWTKIVGSAGSNSLFAYILSPIFYSIFAMLTIVLNSFDFYAQLGSKFEIGFFRSVIFAFSIIWIAGFLRKKGLWLRL